MTDDTKAGLHHRTWEAGAAGPLNGVRVLDLSRLFAGNVLSQQLGDFGADVIKVEPPTGDTLRDWRSAGVSAHWKVYSRNKRSLALDLRSPESKDVLLKLAATASVFMESFRPGVLEKMGLGPEVLLAANPKLIIVRISGWGQDGPYHRRPGFGTVIEGMSGFAAINGFEDREPVLPPMYLADGVAGLYGASAVLIALRAAEAEGGKGQVIDLPLYDPLLAIMGPQAAQYRLTGKLKPRTGSRSTNSAPRNAYRCSDGKYVGLSGSTQTMAERVLRTIGRPELVDDPRFRTNSDRLKNVEALDAIVAEFFARYTQAEAVALMEKAEVTVGPIYDASQILEDPHVIDREILADYDDPDVGAFPMHHVVPRLEATPGSIRAPAPGLGQDNRAILAEIGVDEATYADWLGRGIAVEGGK
ncbi:MAG: CoA transferase [Caulobacterales bacterium 68-7]|nr:MAG: CoA transferase [Caulobacterales bacterium 68-7]